MKPKFQITKDYKYYVIKKRRYFIFPITYLRIMDKTEFLPELSDYGYNMLRDEYATFKSVGECFEALSQWASLNGVEQIIVKTVDRS